jgi:predicted glutamine amidotransferase
VGKRFGKANPLGPTLLGCERKMCRMMAIIGDSSIKKSDLLLKFRCLSACGNVRSGAPFGHEDGWGILSYRDNSPKHLGRSTEPAWKNVEYGAACERIADMDRVVLAHLRKASSGDVSLENTQPLVSGKWSFGHNGTVYSPSFNTGSVQSDSRVILDKLVRAIEESGPTPIERVITKKVAQIHEEIQREPDKKGRTYSSLTFMLSDGESLYVLRDFTEEEDYYTMYYFEPPGGAIFCQERIWSAAWKPLGNRMLAIVNREGRIRIEACE